MAKEAGARRMRIVQRGTAFKSEKEAKRFREDGEQMGREIEEDGSSGGWSSSGDTL